MRRGIVYFLISILGDFWFYSKWLKKYRIYNKERELRIELIIYDMRDMYIYQVVFVFLIKTKTIYFRFGKKSKNLQFFTSSTSKLVALYMLPNIED